MSIPQSFIQELLARADVVEIVGRYVQLKKGGANFMGLCPFHGEKSPSFSVSPTKQFYHCFGCGKSGDAIQFLVEHTGMTFFEAVTDLAGQYGMQIPEDDTSPQERAKAQEQRQKQHTLTSVLEKACDAYRSHLKESPRAVAYFKGRGVTGKIAKQFGLGYAPEGWRNLASVFPHYDDPLLTESGLVIAHEADGSEEAKRYDRFRDRVMFPIRNIKGECIGFGGRVLTDEKPKYLNSPETPVFSKGRELYGLFEARAALREHGYALVTEGYMDVVALAQLGFPNAVATLGTACTPEHVQKLFRFTDAVVFSFDGDAAGRRAARKALDGALPFATDVRSIKFLFLPAEHDPDSFIREYGQAAFADYVAQATPLSRFLLEAAQEGCDLNTAEGRAHFASNAKPLWSRLPDGALRLQLLGEIAELVQLNSRELSDLWTSFNQQNHLGMSWRKNAVTSHSADAPPAWGKGNQSHTFSDWPERSKTNAFKSRPSGMRKGIGIGRADHVARILLAASDLWETLSSEEHRLLCELPPPHGPLFISLETLLLEHGPLTWSAVADEMQGQACAPLAQQLMAEVAPAATAPSQETAIELRDLLNRMLIDRLKSQATQAAQSAGGDAEAMQRYKIITARWKKLQAEIDGTIQL